MNFFLFLNEKTNDGIKRITVELIEDAVNNLNQSDSKFDLSIHETRKNFKKIRAVIRMVRFELGQDSYKKENIFFRDTGRLLSRIRDAAALSESLDKLYNSHNSQIAFDDYRRLKKNLQKRARSIKSQFKRNRDLLDGMIHMLKAEAASVKEWQLGKEDFSLIEDGVKQVYQRGLDALALAIETPSAENFHQWRKRVKYLWHIVKILDNAWPETMTPLADKLDILSDHLGNEHDLAELRELLIRDTSLFDDAAIQPQFLTVLGQERLQLQAKAKSLAPYIYNESADEFVKRIKAYWEQSMKNLPAENILNQN